MGLFFVFPDVSIRWRGRFQLGVTLIMISMSEQLFVVLLSISLCFSARPDQCGISEEGKTLAQTRTSTFEVLPRHEYIAARLCSVTLALNVAYHVLQLKLD
jgi:hypothetical protein